MQKSLTVYTNFAGITSIAVSHDGVHVRTFTPGNGKVGRLERLLNRFGYWRNA